MMTVGFLVVVALSVAFGVWRWRALVARRQQAAAEREAQLMLIAATAKAAAGKNKDDAQPRQDSAPGRGPVLPAARAADIAAPRGSGAWGDTLLEPRPPAPKAAPPAQAASAGAPSLPSAAGRGNGRPYLARPERALYAGLRTAFPDLEVLAYVSLRRVLGSQALPTDLRASMLLCHPGDFSALAVIDLARPDEPPAMVRMKQEKLAAGGVAYLRWEPSALPAAAEMPALLAKALRP